MLEMWGVEDVEYWGSGIFRCGMFWMLDVWDVGF